MFSISFFFVAQEQSFVDVTASQKGILLYLTRQSILCCPSLWDNLGLLFVWKEKKDKEVKTGQVCIFKKTSLHWFVWDPKTKVVCLERSGLQPRNIYTSWLHSLAGRSFFTCRDENREVGLSRKLWVNDKNNITAQTFPLYSVFVSSILRVSLFSFPSITHENGDDFCCLRLTLRTSSENNILTL